VTSSGSSSVFAGFRFPPEVISVAVRWYLRYGLSYRDVEELLAERGVTVDHVTIYRWVQRFTPEFVEAARPCRHAPGDRWFVDETYVKVSGQWAYLYRAVDQHGQVIDVLLSIRRDLAAGRRFFTRAMRAGAIPAEVTTDRAPAYPGVLDELIPSALHTVEQYANNPVEADHGRLKARLRPMRGLKSYRSARILAAGHAFVQNLRRGHYDIATDVSGHHRLQKAFDDLAITIRLAEYPSDHALTLCRKAQRNSAGRHTRPHEQTERSARAAGREQAHSCAAPRRPLGPLCQAVVRHLPLQ
jgi:transposase, IS6 family